MALGSTQPLTEMSTRSISWGKDGRCVRLTNLTTSCAVVMKAGNLNSLQPSGPLLYLYLYHYTISNKLNKAHAWYQVSTEEQLRTVEVTNPILNP